MLRQKSDMDWWTSLSFAKTAFKAPSQIKKIAFKPSKNEAQRDFYEQRRGTAKNYHTVHVSIVSINKTVLYSNNIRTLL